MTRLNRSFLLIALAVFGLRFTFGMTSSVSTNFYKEEIGVVGQQMGYLSSSREFVGFLIVIVAALTVRFPVSKVAAGALIILGIGTGLYSQVHSFPALLSVGLVASLGFHSWTQLYYVLALSIARPGHEGRMLGRLNAIGSAGTLVAMLISLASVAIVGYRGLYLVAAGSSILAGLGMMFVEPNQNMVRQTGFVIRKRYWLYYLLNFLDGCRFETFSTFSIFALVDVYHIGVRTITTLLMIASVITWFSMPILGSWIDRWGERRVLSLAYSINLLVFLTFALSPNIWILMSMYLAYRVFAITQVGTSTYLKRIADPQDLSPSLAMGVTASHAPAMTIPIIGGFLWQSLGYQFSFLFGAFFVLLSIIAVQQVRTPRSATHEVALSG